MNESTKMTKFGELINDNQDYGLPSIFRECFNEIHRIIFPNPCRDEKGFYHSGKECRFTLVTLECITFDHHMLNFPFHSLPKEVMSFMLRSFEEPRVLCRWRSIEFIKDACLIFVLWESTRRPLYLKEEPAQE